MQIDLITILKKKHILYVVFWGGKWKTPDRKTNFCSKFTVKLFSATVANDDIGSLKSLHTLLNKYLDHMLVNLNKII